MEQFLNLFYACISFDVGQSDQMSRVCDLFCEGAVLMEFTETGWKHSDIHSYVKAFQETCDQYPELFLQGFKEWQTSYEVLHHAGMYLVRSAYKKQYMRGGTLVQEPGVQMMSIVEENQQFKIVSIVW